MIGFQSKHDPNIENWPVFIRGNARNWHTQPTWISLTSYRHRCSSLGRTYAIDIGEYSTHGGGQVATITDVGVRALSCALSIRQTPPNPTSRTLTTVLHEDAIFVYMRLKDPEVRSLPSDFFVARSKVRRSFDFLLRRLTSRVGISRLVQSSFRCIDRVYSSRDLLSTSLCDRIFKSVSLLKMDLSCDFLFFFSFFWVF